MWWYVELPADVNESLAEFIVCQIIKSNNRFVQILGEVDKKNLKYYQRWKDPERLSQNVDFHYIALIIRFARTNIWQG